MGFLLILFADSLPVIRFCFKKCYPSGNQVLDDVIFLRACIQLIESGFRSCYIVINKRLYFAASGYILFCLNGLDSLPCLLVCVFKI